MTRVWIAAFAAATANAVLADTKLYIRSAAADPTVLVPPSPPDFQRDYAIELFQGDLEGLSIPQSGSYLGFSIELSQANRIIGSNSSTLAIPFLNHIQNVAARVGSVRVRVGGSTQDNSRLEYNTLPDESGSAFRVLEPQTAEGKTYVYVEFSPDAIQVLANVGEQVKTEWFLGLNFQDWWDTSNKAQVAGLAESMLGSSLGGIALGNEPDLYALDGHGKRPAPYTFDKYFEEWGSVASALSDNSNFTNPNILMGPSTCCRSSNPEFDNEDMAAAGYFSRFDKELKIATVTRYPTNNCGISPHRAQEEFADFLSHSLLSEHAAAYANYSRIVQAAGKPLYMLETNTAACGGFPGVSDSFGAGLWAVDWALKLATYNFSSTFLHTGGLTDYYNPFTPPPANESTFHQWTTGPVYYSSLVVAELFGKSGKSQIVDLNANQGENLTPGYAVYEDGVPTRVLLINYADDPAGAHDATARISIGGSNGQGSLTPKQVRVKYLSAPSVSSKGNITWAGQTLGNAFESDGRMKGQEIVETVSCDASINSCIVPLKAPSLALVFLSEAAYQNSAPSSNVSYSFKANIKGSQGNNSGSNQESSAAMDGPLGLGAFAGLMAGAVALAVCLRW